ncbi:hypothetical protein KIL84_005567 [Mauremys mutica]|uniref:Uncharacterized protein n=1 Tax=Mauremys mutica TaxID=74926 RepID=A0A9D4AWZ1_9SAUR|nr:hypothetical protein KIL84_005567 [Mauremys mutica]
MLIVFPGCLFLSQEPKQQLHISYADKTSAFRLVSFSKRGFISRSGLIPVCYQRCSSQTKLMKEQWLFSLLSGKRVCSMLQEEDVSQGFSKVPSDFWAPS